MAVIKTDDPPMNESLGLDKERIPKHVAIIMDGNGRWAKSRGLPRSEGHRQGTENLRRIIRAAVEFDVKILTLYAFLHRELVTPPPRSALAHADFGDGH